MHTLNYADKQTLIQYLKGFYSLGQLQWIYRTLTGKAFVLDMTEFERQARITAIEEILSEAKIEVKRPANESANEPANETAARIPLAKAQRLAGGLLERLEEYCDRIHIAGSIRRLKSEVKDIEIVCQPKTFVEADFLLFGSGSRNVQVIPAFKREVESLGKIIKGKPDGRYMQFDLPSGIKLDLFMPQPHDYFRQYAIRTGSADYSSRVIATGWKNLGWCGTSDGLRKINECEVTKSGWKCSIGTPTLPPAWQNEVDFFDWLGIPYLNPQDRH